MLILYETSPPDRDYQELVGYYDCADNYDDCEKLRNELLGFLSWLEIMDLLLDVLESGYGSVVHDDITFTLYHIKGVRSNAKRT